jgi:xylulose-5-phosphate/fructose-6-phosphate phosphoketolase
MRLSTATGAQPTTCRPGSGLAVRVAHAKQTFRDKLIDHHHYVVAHGEDMPEVRDWSWPYQRGAAA